MNVSSRIVTIGSIDYEVEYLFDPGDPGDRYTAPSDPDATITRILVKKEVEGRQVKIDIKNELEAISDCEEFLNEVLRHEAEYEPEY